MYWPRITALKTTLGEQQRRFGILNKPTANALLVPSYASWPRKLLAFDASLRSYASSFPSDARSTAFKLPSQVPFVRVALQMQGAIQSWRELLPQTFETVQKRESQVEKLMSEWEITADLPLLQEYSDFLGGVLRRESGDSGAGDVAREAIISMFDKPIIPDLTMLKFKDGSIYYLTESRTYAGNPILFRYLTDYDKTNLKSSLGVKYEHLSFGKTLAAPHVVIATKIRKRFQLVMLSKRRTECLKAIKELLIEEELDPLLKCLLGQQVVEFSRRGDVGLAHGLKPIAKILNDPGIDFSAPWIDPTNDAASANRCRAAEKLEPVTPEFMD